MSSPTAPAPQKHPVLSLPWGLLDKLAGPHGIDGYLEQVNLAWTVQACTAEVTAVARSAEDSVTLSLRANRAWQGFRAGQFVPLSVEINGSRRTRCYSPTSAAGNGRELELTIKRHPSGLVSNFLNDRACPGMHVFLSQAKGDFQLPDERPNRILLISGGSGITPVMSMLRTLCAERYRGRITFLHYAPDPDRMPYQPELEEIAWEHSNVRLVRCFTRDRGAGEESGRFSQAQLTRVEPDFTQAATFACGPPALHEAVARTWRDQGIEDRLRIESFVPPALAAPSGVAGGSISFAGSGLRVDNNGASLLEQAEAAGLQPPYGCRMGVCHTCSCHKQAGTVRNLISGELSSSEEEPIQLCVSSPVGDVVVDL